MPKNEIITTSPPGVHLMDLEVTILGSEVRVLAGTVRFNSVEYELTEDELYTATLRNFPTNVQAYVILDRTPPSPELRVFVDETVQNAIDVPYKFERDGDYELFAYLYQFTVPAGTTALDDLDWNHWRMLEQS